MNEREKAAAGYLYDANYDESLLQERNRCKDLCFAFNACKPSDSAGQQRLMKQILGKTKGAFTITAPFWCDYGYNISIGENFYTNHNCIILDGAKVTFGDNVFIAPNCCFSTAGHPLDVEQRNKGLEIALPITVGNNVWFGAGVTVLPGVTIGDNAVIGAGSVVNKDIPSGVIAVGNPCRVLRPITEEDKNKYPVLEEK
ncbi:MAG: sugar O-acetyltransferase [Eubacteriales bacterium]|nr:sugar O-acetyltransferase [Eubacteriales bacterium]